MSVLSQIGPYQIERELGRGGMATVYLADDVKHGRKVAIKVMHPELAAAIGQDRFLREIEVAARMAHPHILPLFDSGAADGRLFYVMPFIEGESLRALLTREKQLALEDALRLTREIASALGNAHQHGLVHRDIKPENVLLADGIALVADFGIARTVSSDLIQTAAIRAATTVGTAVGTPLYMAPEQAMGDIEVDGRADQYALGCTLYEMLAGQPPFKATSLQALIARHMNDPVPPLGSARPGVPEGIVRVIEKALAKSPADRYPSMARFVEALTLVSGDLPTPTPAPELEGEAVSNNLPRERTHFIGREKELATCARLLGDTRLLTLTGIGGCGKTRLALKLARSMLTAYPDGIWFVDLAPLDAEALVAPEVAKALGLKEESGVDPVEGILDLLSGACAMLVLDNCEHLLDASADLADRVLAKAPEVRLLVTSREGLGIEGERLFAVRSLSLPPEGVDGNLETIGASEAVRLFVDRASGADQEFVLDGSNAADVSEICRRLDGIPLAIELAAARTRALSVHQIRAMLDDRFRLLTGGSRSSVERHRTLRATVQWSYDHLEADEQELFMVLSVFAGGWTLNAAAALTGSDEFEVLDHLTRLIDKSLIHSEQKSGSEARYRMLETLRQFGQDLLTASGRSDSLRAAHLKYFLGVIDGMQPELGEKYPVAAIARIKPEVDNLRLALTWGFQNDSAGAVRLTRKLIKLWYTPGFYGEGLRWYRQVLALGDLVDPATRSDAYFRSGRLTFQVGDYQGALKHYQSTLEIVRASEEPVKEFQLSYQIAVLHTYLGDYDAAERAFEESERLGQQLDDPLRVGRLEVIKGYGKLLRGDLTASRNYFESYLNSRRWGGTEDGLQIALGNLSMVDIAEGNTAQAREHLRECLAINRKLENLYGIAHFLPMLAATFRLEGDPVTAARLVGAVSALLDQTEAGLEPMQRKIYQQLISDLKDEMGEEPFSTSRREGRTLSWQEAIELV